MKLSRPLLPHQLLFVLLTLALAAGSAIAQDRIFLKDGRIQEVKIVGATPLSIQVQVAAGAVGVPMAQVDRVEMAAPAEFTAAATAYEAGDYAKALAGATAVAAKFQGLPTPWAQRAAAMVGDAHVALNQIDKAEAAYANFQKLYPGQGSKQADVGLARIAIAREDFDAAKAKLEPVAEEALKQKAVGPTDGMAYSQTFLLLGQINEHEGNHSEALRDYLRTVTVFPHDRSAVAAAQQRADAIRKEHGAVVP